MPVQDVAPADRAHAGRGQSPSARANAGLTLVELLIVMAIVSLLAGLAIVGAASFTNVASDAMERTTRDVYSMLRAARIYASTYSVETAVVYSLGPAKGDSITGLPVRELAAAALMYKYPDASNGFYHNKFVPIPGEQGSFKIFEPDVAIPLWDVTQERGGAPYYGAAGNLVALSDCSMHQPLARLGLVRVTALYENEQGQLGDGNFLAHIYESTGRMRLVDTVADCSGLDLRERNTFYIAPTANADLGDRVIDPDNPLTSGYIYNPIHVFRSTGRAEIGT